MADQKCYGLDTGGDGTMVCLLRLNAASNLAKKDIFGASDPYVQISLIDKSTKEVVGKTAKTKTIKKTLYPIWDETFRFLGHPNLHQLVLNVFDENRVTRDDFLGRVTLNLKGLKSGNEKKPYQLTYHQLEARSNKSKVRGHLQLHICFESNNEEEQQQQEERKGSEVQPVVFQDVTGRIFEGNEHPIQDGGTTDFSGLEDIADANPVRFDDVETMGATSLAFDDVEQVNSSQEEGLLDNMNDIESVADGLALPSWWEERTDTNGRTLYANHETRRTQVQHPQLTQTIGMGLEDETGDVEAAEFRSRTHVSVDEVEENAAEDSSNNVAVVTDRLVEQLHLDSEGADSARQAQEAGEEDGDDEQLPPNWEKRKAKNGSTYYVNHSKKTTQWERPRPERPDSLSSSNAAKLESSSPELPYGWAKKTAPNGREFYLDHLTRKTTWINPVTGEPSPRPQLKIPHHDQVKVTEGLGPLPEGWEERIHKDGRTFFINHNNKTTQWEDPRFSDSSISGQLVPYNRDYKLKYDDLKVALNKELLQRELKITVRRKHIFEDSFSRIMYAPNRHLLKGKLDIEFDNERGLDYGGLSREWFYLLSKEMFNPYYGFFEYSATDNYTLQINPHSAQCNENHLQYFEFFGRIAGMAVFHGKLLDAFFIRPFYKMLLGKNITIHDMESVDAEYYNSLVWIRENDPTDLDLSFQVEDEKFGETQTIELKPGGNDIQVTDKNKEEYIDLVVKWRFVSRVKEQMKAFKKGFEELIPLYMIKVFDEGELELLLGGIGAIDVKDWKAHTEYKGEYHENHLVIQWFWRLVLTMNNEMRSRLLQFVTGTSRVPMNGFKELYGSNGPRKFCIQMIGTTDSYPRSHTCFNRIDLPPYDSYDKLVNMVLGAIEGAEGFGGVD